MERKRKRKTIPSYLIIVIIAIPIILTLSIVTLKFIWGNEAKNLQIAIEKERTTLNSYGTKDYLNYITTGSSKIPEKENGIYFYKKADEEIFKIYPKPHKADIKLAKVYPELFVSDNKHIDYDNYFKNPDLEKINFKNPEAVKFIYNFNNVFKYIKEGNEKKRFAWEPPYTPGMYISNLQLICSAYSIKTIALVNEKKYKEAEDNINEASEFLLNLLKNEYTNNTPFISTMAQQQHSVIKICQLYEYLGKSYPLSQKLLSNLQKIHKSYSTDTVTEALILNSYISFEYIKNKIKNKDYKYITSYFPSQESENKIPADTDYSSNTKFLSFFNYAPLFLAENELTLLQYINNRKAQGSNVEITPIDTDNLTGKMSLMKCCFDPKWSGKMEAQFTLDYFNKTVTNISQNLKILDKTIQKITQQQSA